VSAAATPVPAAETIGVDLGGTKMAVGVLAGTEVLHNRRRPSRGLGEGELVEALVEELRAAREARPGAVAIGLGIPATLDQEKGIAVSAVNLTMNELPIRDLVEERVGLPTFVDNDANVAALAENLYGAGRGCKQMVMLTIGTGIGGGLVLNGELYRGATGAGAELGHTVIEVDGPRCQGNCPGRGCVEALASGTALGREARAAAEESPDSALARMLAEGREIDGRAATEAAQAGDPTAIAVFETIGGRLGAALTTFANVFEPQAIVVGGGVMAAGDLLLEPAREVLRKRALPPMNRTPVLAAELGPDAGLIGAAALARTELERRGG